MAVESVALSWTQTSLGGSFDRYLIFRGGDKIAEITNEADTSFTDYEARIGVQESYDIKVKHTNGTTSLVSSDTATITSQTSWTLTSNEDASVNVEFDVTAVDWGWPRHRSVYELYGRDNAVVLRGSEDGGDAFALSVELFGTEGSNEDRAMFDALLAAQDADVAQLCLRSPFGRRWWCDVQAGGGSERWATYAELSLTVREVSDVPSVVEVG